jgi:DNA repair photolyase
VERKITKSRGAGFNPQNRFEEIYIDYLAENHDEEYNEEKRSVPTTFYIDATKSILAKNDSPDIGFTYSINPYRGCEHGCIYCYARPSHEYLGFSSGIDFETKIMIKPNAPALLEEALRKKSWVPQTVMFSGNTDCYQPVERKLMLTRKCLEVFLKYRNPVGIVTKNALVTRDLDILREMAKLDLVTVTISITTLHRSLSRKLEPRTSVPSQRLQTVETLAKENIQVGILVAPIIPGLNDEEIPSILKAAADHGALHAGRVMLRLPYSIKDLFIEWIERNYPDKKSRIINRIKDTRSGKLNSYEFKKRMSGEGEIANSIHRLFKASCKKYGLNKTKIHLTTEHFLREPDSHQTSLFNDAV